jgi:hypothetical protein
MGVDSEIQRQNEIVTSIETIRKLEDDLTALLDSPNEIDKENRDNIINQIGKLFNMRKNMLEHLSSTYNKLHNNISDSKINFADKKSVTDIITNEIELSTNKYKLLADEKNNKKRMTEINMYHGKKYNAYSNVMKTLLISCTLLLILTYVIKHELMSPNITYILVGIVIFFGGFRISLLILDIIRRDNMNYDKFNWDFTEPTGASSIYVEQTDKATNAYDDVSNNSKEIETETVVDNDSSIHKVGEEHNYLTLHTHGPTHNEGFRQRLPRNSISVSSLQAKKI